MALIERLQSEDSVALEIDGEEVARLLSSPGREELIERMGDYATGMNPFREYVEDLEAVQRMTSQFFPLPEAVTGDDRLLLRCIRLLLEGNCIVMPGYRELNQTLSGESLDLLRDILGGGPRSALVEMPNLRLELLGHTFDLGQARLYAPQVEVVGPGSLLEALDAGTVAGKPITMRASDGYGIWAFLPALLETADGVVRPVGLGLEGVDDAPDVSRALESLPRQSAAVANELAEEKDDAG